MVRLLLYIFLIYLAYQFIFRFVIPVYRTTQQVKKGFREMHDRMNDVNNGQRQSASQTQSSDNTPKEKVGEYIDFEEIK